MVRRDVAQGLPRHLEEKFSKHPYLLNVSFESITRCFFRCQISIPKNVSENSKKSWLLPQIWTNLGLCSNSQDSRSGTTPNSW